MGTVPVIRVGVGWPGLGEGGLTLALRLHGALGSRLKFEGATKAPQSYGEKLSPRHLRSLSRQGVAASGSSRAGVGKA